MKKCANRWFLGAVLGCICLVPGAAWADNPCNEPGDFPDVIVGDLHQTQRYGTVGGITAFSVGTVSCNIGTCQLEWFQNSNRHPAIGQTMYRLKDGRFEQIGQGWLKHGFFALSEDLCFDDCLPTSGTYLGVHCSDPYSAGLNGQQSNLGPKFEVNPSTGEFPWPPTNLGQTGNAIFKRIQVKNDDLDPALNVGAEYVVEGHYVSGDDAEAFRHFNNASHRPINITGTAGNWNIQLTGSTVRQQAAIDFWAAQDPTVLLKRIGSVGDGIYSAGSKATDLGNGRWHYEYAVHNLNSHRSAGSFSVPLPYGANVTNIGFHDVDYHSGEPWVGTDWVGVVADNKITWASETEEENPNANALRWGTTYNFRFEVDFPPVQTAATIGLWRAGAPATLAVPVRGPQVCDGDGVCDPGEDCTLCPSDCSNQGGGGGCCGDDVCDPGETNCSCIADCGLPAVEEFICNDGEDDDCDGLTDCADSQCCSDASCTGPDGDNDGFELCDCDDTNADVWTRPDEAENNLLVGVLGGDALLEWDPPLNLGATQVTYEVLRSANPLNFVTSTVCLADPDVTDTELLDSETPPAGVAFSYLVRAVNGCPADQGRGEVGRDSSNVVRPSTECP